MVLGEARVAHEKHLAVLGAAVDLAPGIHDEGIVGSNDDNDVNALGCKLVLVLEVGRDVEGLAGRGESAGHGDEDNLLAGELLGGVVGLGEATGGGAGVGDGGPAGNVVSARCFCAGLLSKVRMQGAYSNLTSEGNLSPALMGAIVIREVGSGGGWWGCCLLEKVVWLWGVKCEEAVWT